MGRTATATALIEEGDTPAIGIEILAVKRGTATTGATVQKDHRDALRVAALFVVQLMQIADAQTSGVKGFDRWIK
jgi:hypothetical protein